MHDSEVDNVGLLRNPLPIKKKGIFVVFWERDAEPLLMHLGHDCYRLWSFVVPRFKMSGKEKLRRRLFGIGISLLVLLGLLYMSFLALGLGVFLWVIVSSPWSLAFAVAIVLLGSLLQLSDRP